MRWYAHVCALSPGHFSRANGRICAVRMYIYIYMVVDLKVLDSIVYDDDPEHIKISFGKSFFSSWRKYFFAKDLAKD